jgi:formate dehydrogenase major subunit
MTNHWVDIKNADAVLIMGSNAAENHPVAFKWVMEAKANRNATIISVDPRFTRSSSKADIYAPMRSGTDIVFLGAMINYAISNNLINQQYVKDCTNALCRVDPGFKTCRDSGTPGLFSGWTGGTTYGSAYTTTTWDYLLDGVGDIAMAANLDVADCVYQKLKKQYETYTPEMVEKICGTPRALFKQICEAYIGGTYQDAKSGTMLYAMGWTQHTVGSQNIRTAAILQLLLGNMGVAGGGINALRGWQNVQGSTDHAVLYDWFPGYIGYPENTADLGYSTLAGYIAKVTPANLDPVIGVAPASGNWKTKFNLYITSTLKAWWPDADGVNPAIPTIAYTYLPKRAVGKNYSHISIFEDMLPPDIPNGKTTGDIIKGLFVWGTNPGVTGPNVKRERDALNNLNWMVVCDIFETETSNFWKYNPDGTPRADGGLGQGTEVFLLPGSAFFEREGSATNSGRLAQWKDKACNPPGDALSEEEILEKLGNAIKTAYDILDPTKHQHPRDDGILNLAWPAGALLTGTVTEKVAKEINGYLIATGVQVSGFGDLTATGTTACGNWLFSGTWPAVADSITGNKNQMLNRNPADYGTGNVIRTTNTIGNFAKWGYAWPANRRIIYNRASVYQTGANEGKPLAPDKWVIECTTLGTLISPPSTDAVYKTGGDVVDGYATSRPQNVYPFIMNNEGLGKLMGIKKLNEGPFPEHYEPRETPLTANPLTSAAFPLYDPCVYNYPGALYATPGDPDYPIIATTYRLSEHWHGGGMSRNLPGLVELMPEPFVEMSEELAADTTLIPTGPINNGDAVIVTSIRGSITVKACVTKRWKPFVINGQVIHEVGMPWHWGHVSSIGCTGDSANVLTPHIGDANTRIPEYKAFLVKIEKA